MYFLSSLQKSHRFHISGSREHVHAACLHKLIPTAFKYLHVTRKACRLARYINYRIDAEIDNRADCFRMDSITRRIEYDYIGLVREISDNLKNITRYEFTVVKTVKMCILARSHNGLLYDFNTHNLGSARRHHLRNRTGAAVKVEHDLILKLSDIFTRLGIKDLSAERVGLEERKRRNFET